MMKELNKISEKNPFKVPENYFEEANRKIISSTSGHYTEQIKKGSYRKLRPYLAVAASVAVLVLLSYTAIYIFSPAKTNSGLPEITLNEFSDNYLSYVDILTLEENAGTIEPDVSHLNINSRDIIDYLVLENIDINDIYEQL
jgi:hypothetical protein